MSLAGDGWVQLEIGVSLQGDTILLVTTRATLVMFPDHASHKVRVAVDVIFTRLSEHGNGSDESSRQELF